MKTHKKKLKKNFAIIGIAGFIARRHISVIKNLGHDLVLSCDLHQNVGFIDNYFPNCSFTTSENKFFNNLKKKKVDYVVICTPNYLHYRHIISSLKHNTKVICEKPLILKKNELNNLVKLNTRLKSKINIILQLRLNKNLIKIKEFIKKQKNIDLLNLNYVTPRGTWYDNTWKSNQKKSGGVKTNIGIHLFDVVCQLFGEPSSMKSLMKTKRKFKGMIYFKNKIKLSFNLSINAEDLPRGMKSYRVLQVNKKKFDLSKSFTNLHEESYRRILANKGFKIDSYTTVFNLVSKI